MPHYTSYTSRQNKIFYFYYDVTLFHLFLHFYYCCHHRVYKLVAYNFLSPPSPHPWALHPRQFVTPTPHINIYNLKIPPPPSPKRRSMVYLGIHSLLFVAFNRRCQSMLSKSENAWLMKNAALWIMVYLRRTKIFCCERRRRGCWVLLFLFYFIYCYLFFCWGCSGVGGMFRNWWTTTVCESEGVRRFGEIVWRAKIKGRSKRERWENRVCKIVIWRGFKLGYFLK